MTATNKSAVVIVLDIGPSMDEAAPGHETPLQTSMTAIKMLLERKMFAELKDEVSLILCGTEDSDNNLNYDNISTIRSLSMVDWQFIEFVEKKIAPTIIQADWLDAVVVALDELVNGTRGKKGITCRRITLFSNLGGKIKKNGLEEIIQGFVREEIEFVIVGPNKTLKEENVAGQCSSDEENGHHDGYKPSTALQRSNIQVIQDMLSSNIDGAVHSFEEAIDTLMYFETREVRPTAWKVQLLLGAGVRINVAGYIKTKEVKAKNFKEVYGKDIETKIEKEKTYHLNNEEQTEIEPENVIQGHRYGSTLVPMDESDFVKVKSEKCLNMIGITDASNVSRSYILGDSCMIIVADKDDETAITALAAVVQALHNTQSVMIVRRLYNAASAPKIGCLTPYITNEFQGFIYNELPFSEDIRAYEFGSLPVSSNAACDAPLMQKAKPTAEQLSAMDDLITAMDMPDTAKSDTDGYDLGNIQNPYLQRLFKCLKYRAIHPDEQLPEIPSHIKQSLELPPKVVSSTAKVLPELNRQFKLQRVVKRKNDAENIFENVTDKSKRDRPKEDQPGDDNADAISSFSRIKVTEVRTVNPVEDFEQIIQDTSQLESGSEKMIERIKQLVTDSFGSQFYPKAHLCIASLRAQLIKHNMPTSFNKFYEKFKILLNKKDRGDFWTELCDRGVSLISSDESAASGVSAQSAREFIRRKVEPKPEPARVAPADDLLDEME